MKLEDILLGVLLRHPSTGYDLKKYLDTTGRFLRSNTQMSQVYRSLATMEERGWVTHDVETRVGAKDAKTYRVTDEGATIFLDRLKGEYHPPSRFEDPEFLARLSFAGFLEPGEVLSLVETELRARRDQVARYRFRDRSTVVETTLEHDAVLAAGVGEWSHRRGAAAVDAHLAACEDLRRRLLDGDWTFTDREAGPVAARQP
ncbi:PadR family transcriptional regulator [Kineococcus sp. LSe6-4]|uniref:PadR family transcriptional regulator n=1 Tax=Kineococcus halophytocola TaxID=3234027 RepID=A0ABV4GYL4_9ACTN